MVPLARLYRTDLDDQKSKARAWTNWERYERDILGQMHANQTICQDTMCFVWKRTSAMPEGSLILWTSLRSICYVSTN